MIASEDAHHAGAAAQASVEPLLGVGWRTVSLDSDTRPKRAQILAGHFASPAATCPISVANGMSTAA
jgi:hypothetical protein